MPLCRPIASATEVYAYLGADYTSVDGPYTTNDYISGSFTTSSILPPNLTNSPITPLAWSFGDGIFDWTNSNSIDLVSDVSTDAYGTLTSAYIELYGTLLIPQPPDSPLQFVGEMFIRAWGDDVTLYDLNYGPSPIGEASNSVPGKWGPDFDPPDNVVPEPASVVLFTSAALLAFAFRGRRRLA